MGISLIFVWLLAASSESGGLPLTASEAFEAFVERQGSWEEQRPQRISKGAAGNYPLAAQTLQLSGESVVGFVIDKTGKPRNLVILWSNPRGFFDLACTTFVASFRYRPQRMVEGFPRIRRWAYQCTYTLD